MSEEELIGKIMRKIKDFDEVDNVVLMRHEEEIYFDFHISMSENNKIKTKKQEKEA